MDSLVEEEVLAEVAQVEDGKMIFNTDERQQIESLIKETEQQSSAELVAVITQTSNTYREAKLFVSLILTALCSLALQFLDAVELQTFLLTQVIVFSASYFVFDFKTSLLLALLPKSYKYKVASHVAHENFQKLGLHLTTTKQAIMFYVSLDEKYVEIITDSKIKEKLADSYWEEIVSQFIEDVHNKNICQGYINAIESCKALLIQTFPIEDDDVNELSDEVIEI